MLTGIINDTLLEDVFLALLLDFIFGDPEWFPHPVRFAGKLVSGLEKFSRKAFRWERAGGLFTVAAAAVSVSMLVLLSIIAAHAVYPPAGRCVSVFWIYTGLSARNLSEEAKSVFYALKKQNLPVARKRLSRIVGRDTEKMDEASICRATIETVAENTVDGIVSPLFYVFIGGPALMWLFKTVSTCDSMLGYKNDKYRFFGTAAARLDDLMNFLPARLMYLLCPLASAVAGISPLRTLRIALRDSRKHPSPNAGIPEAAVAGALKVRLGGPARYEGKISDKDYFGKEYPDPEPDCISISLRLMWIVTCISAILMGLSCRLIDDEISSCRSEPLCTYFMK